MRFFLILGFVASCNAQQEPLVNRCDVPRTLSVSTLCTSCAASPTAPCPKGYRKATAGMGKADCRYTVDIAGRLVSLPGCRHVCEKEVTDHRCCPNFWGPLCLPCPNWDYRPCNWHGTCTSGNAGNGTCVCDEGFAGVACHECKDKNAYGENCQSKCSCVNGVCDGGPSGKGECLCQPPYSGPKCDHATASCSNCTAYSYCKGEGSQATCTCLPGFQKVGRICSGICSKNICDVNAECTYLGGRNFQCKCKAGYEGDGKVCSPVNPCSTNRGGCPANSTICVYTGPGKSRCECMEGMEGQTPQLGCRLKSACAEGTCDRTALCDTDLRGQPRCLCDKQQIGDGRRCYGNIMERVLELDEDGDLTGKLTGSVTLFEKGCMLTLSRYGPFTVLLPLLKVPLSGISERFLCKQHLIQGQHLYKDLQSNDFWTLGGMAVRFKGNKKLILMKDPDTSYSIIHSDIAAANGIIHIIDSPITNVHPVNSGNEQHINKTIGEIIAQDPKYNRFLSLVDNCGAPLPLRGNGPLTVFIPTNSGIDRFRDGSLMFMLTHAKHKLQELLKHHVFSQAAITVDQVASMSRIETMANQVVGVNVTYDGKILLGEKGILLETTDIIASNGIIHTIDGVLIPPSILPILPHRCDVNESKITVAPCVMCHYLHETECPPGSVELLSVFPGSVFQLANGCAKYCNLTQPRAECCRGFFGPDCKPCIGGFQQPCYGKGTCFDGIHGNGTCLCSPRFTGVACHICSEANKHGEKCDEDCRCVHGVCDNRPGSAGKCRLGSCQAGYSGDFCDKMAKPCDSDGTFEHCHINAYCTFEGDYTKCVCLSGYEGDGHSCTAVNPCLGPSRGGCHALAECVYVGPANVSCVCNKGWTGDGLVCAEIDNCLLETRGGCHSNATCTFIGPGQNECMCKPGYMGDGQMCDRINPCRANGGCHRMARCEVVGDGRVCTCPEGFAGDGLLCYGTLMEELDGNWDYYTFNAMLQKLPSLGLRENITALVPVGRALQKFKLNEIDFWKNPYVLPHLLKAHFLVGIFTLEDLKQHFNEELVTLNPGTKWEIKNNSGEVMIQNATIITPDIPVVNGYIHIINQVLKPPLSDIPPLPPTLMEFLNGTSAFSLFRRAALAYNLTGNIYNKDYTVLLPTDEAIKEHLQATNSTELGEELFKYHIIIDERVFPDHFDHGMVKNTLLGSSFQIFFHFNHENKTLANEVILSGNFSETFKGVVIRIPRVLELHKNRCNTEIMLRAAGYCTGCDSKPRCPYRHQSVLAEFPANMKSNCKHRKRVRMRRRTMPGCVIECFRYTEAHNCCPGYFGHSCFKCPGKIDNWCSNNGKCQDGVLGTGECLCNEGFHGTACEDCKSVCNCEHGMCMEGIEGSGKCLCYKGWRGSRCSEQIVMDACGGVCDLNANCLSAQGTPPTCVCIAGYKGTGTVCKEINPCDSDNGHCSKNANCTKTHPGERICTCREGFSGDGVVCEEIDGCSVNNGFCDSNAECARTGPNQVACSCNPGYSGNGRACYSVNPCRTDNGGCSWNARCEYVGPGLRNCTCRYNYIGDGITCRGTVKTEVLRNAESSWFNRNLMVSKVMDLLTKGPLTAFVPHTNYTTNFPMELWKNASRAGDLLRYHVVGCQQLLLSDLQSVGKVVSLSGHVLRFSVREGTLYINGDAKIITSDYVASNGVIHFIDTVLVPYDLKNTSGPVNPTLNVTSAAEAYGYTTFSRLLQSSNLMSMVENYLHHPFTMFWPTNEVFSSLSEDRKRWLYSEDHRDKLAAYLKAHIIRDAEILAVNLPHQDSVRTMHGSSFSFACDKNSIGDILVDDGNARIGERHLQFNVGIAYGIDQLLEPPGIGARCDAFAEQRSMGRCGSCFAAPMCSFGYKNTDQTTSCTYGRPSPFSPYRRYGFYSSMSYRRQFRGMRPGCQRTCIKVDWSPRCCENHYGRDCQVCPGGLEAVCSNNGRCLHGMEGSGRCRCSAGFTGTACELCAAFHYGPNCTSCACTEHGKCDDGLGGDGSCFCQEGWTGPRCESKLAVKPVCSPECHQNAVCQPDNICVCESLYEGNGRNCSAPDLCSEENGGCHQHANCSQTGVNVNCTCLSKYAGDGYACSPIDRCVEEENGGCSDFATCHFTGPNERDCKCLPGYVGNGVQCLEKIVPPLDRCLEENGGCDPNAVCKDLHFHENMAGVFQLRSPLGKYKLNYTAAEAACQGQGGALATVKQLSDAQQLGMHMCVAGWLDGKQVGYPTIFPSAKCGDNHVGIVLYKNPVDLSSTYDTYCHRVKDVSCECRPDYVGNGEYCNGNLVTVVATNSNFSVFYKALLSYANSTKDGESLMNYLLKRSTYVTLFVPENTGFFANESLSWRDVEYHISINNSVHLYSDMKHGGVIPSRLGYNLSVTTTLSADSQSNKLVNKKLIIDWDIPATNGIIHIIKGPLKAPPKPVVPVSSHSKARSGAGTVASVLIVFLLIAVVAGLGYYFLKRKNNAFRFQYFKNDDEGAGTEGDNSLVSIPNPLYTGYSAFVEPFGDSPDAQADSQADCPDTQHILD
ncbi:hypothetical protein COCON_G00173290 [Conger conger]|uniref:Stabilin-1 n=1 Tax=Conger conger TaxID=82655 RepID=A0A9Q1D4V4_CONCO|nr:hypothetical protein COCON_G00173290 [Conger conger]